MTITVNNIETAYDIIGSEGPFVLVLPGWSAKKELYRPVAESISSKYRVILLDLPGFTGGTPEPSEPWDVDNFVDFVIAFIGELGIDSLSIAGHSFGGRIIIKLMNRDDLPFKVEKLVLIDAAGIRHPVSGKAALKQKAFKVAKKFMSEKRLEEYKKTHGSADYRNASPLMRMTMVRAINEDLKDLIPGIKAETLLIWGTADTATPISDGEDMERMIEGSGLVRLAGAGHFSFLDQPVVFDKVMKSFFSI
ncbi:MAG: alpha/beta hydrolase [Lachnospiraceae bacterium]|nr:alpha/beta hydrolase [Lachnospiraceae bacterium]